MATHSIPRALWACLLTLMCVGAAAAQSDSADLPWQPVRPVTLTAPSNPGGGWDQTARFLQRALEEDGALGVPVEVVNRGGAGGTIGLGELLGRAGDAHYLMISGFGMTSSALMNNTPFSILDATPIARLTAEYQAIAVPADSPHQTIGDFFTAWQADPRSMSFAGGSAGGSDQIFITEVAQALGIGAGDVNYVAFTGGGEAAAALMGAQVAAGVSGFAELAPLVDTGRVRLLATSAGDRRLDPDLPTVSEAGAPVVFQNWRGVLAAPNLSDDQRAALVEAVERATRTAVWLDALERNDWENAFLPSDDFVAFAAQDRSNTGAVLEAMNISDATEIAAVGPWVFPILVGLGLLASAFMVWRGSTAPLAAGAGLAQPSSPQVSPAPVNLRRVGVAGLVLAAYVLALWAVGFVVATPVFIFALSFLLGRMAWWKTALTAVLLTAAVYLVFDVALGVRVP